MMEGEMGGLAQMMRKRSFVAEWRLMMNSATDGKKARYGISPDERRKLLAFNENAKMLILMVGKPSRKTMLAAKIWNYISWLGYKSKMFKTSDVRLKKVGKVDPDFFDPDNAAFAARRQEFSTVALDQAINYLTNEGGDVVILDSGNYTRALRNRIIEKVKRELGVPAALQSYETKDPTVDLKSSSGVDYRLLWVESLCEDREIVEQNFLTIDRQMREDYDGMTDEDALDWFRRKVAHFDKYYESLSEDDDALYDDELDRLRYNSFIQIVDFGRTLILHHVQGFLESKLGAFCSHIHTQHRAIILVRHGEAEGDREKRIGGDPPITENGNLFSHELAKFISEHLANDFRDTKDKDTSRDGKKAKKGKLSIWTSLKQRTRQTAEHIEGDVVPWVALADLYAGICERMTVEQVQERELPEFQARARDKLNYRYPQGESYVDVKKRIENVLFELERQRNHVLVISHKAVLRCLYSYFMQIGPSEIPFLPFPLHTVVVLRPSLMGWNEKRKNLPPQLDYQS